MKYIKACIESVLQQTYLHVEHVLVDAGSTDGTVQILSSYSLHYPDRIKFVSEPDKGPGDGWNKGLKMAKGDIFGCIGYDDIYTPNAIQTVVEFFRSNGEACFVHGNCDFINENQEIIRKHKVGNFNYQDFANTSTGIATPSAFYKRIVIEKIGGVDSSGDDFDVMLRIAKKFKVYQIDKVLSQSLIYLGSTFYPTDLAKRKEIYRQTYIVSRRYGGHIFSPIAMRYYSSTIICRLHMEPLYPLLLKLLRWTRRVRRKLGATSPGWAKLPTK